MSGAYPTDDELDALDERAWELDTVFSANVRRVTAALRAARASQWEYRVTERSGGTSWTLPDVFTHAEDALATAARQRALLRPGWDAIVERRPVGDWQPYEPGDGA